MLNEIRVQWAAIEAGSENVPRQRRRHRLLSWIPESRGASSHRSGVCSRLADNMEWRAGREFFLNGRADVIKSTCPSDNRQKFAFKVNRSAARNSARPSQCVLNIKFACKINCKRPEEILSLPDSYGLAAGYSKTKRQNIASLLTINAAVVGPMKKWKRFGEPDRAR